MSNENKFRYSILSLLLLFFILLQYSLSIENSVLFYVAISIYCPLWLVCVVFELINDIKPKTNNSKMKDTDYVYKYLFIIQHSFLIYGLFVKDYNKIIPYHPFALLNWLWLFTGCAVLLLLHKFIYNLLKGLIVRKFNNIVNEVYAYGAFIAITLIFTVFNVIGNVGRHLDDSIIQDKKQLFNKYLALCSKEECEETFYFTKGDLLEQKYRVRVYHNSDKEKCVLIQNAYFDPHLSIDECENKKVKTDENSVKIQDK